jgi:hypothetical protein
MYLATHDQRARFALEPHGTAGAAVVADEHTLTDYGRAALAVERGAVVAGVVAGEDAVLDSW